MVDEVHIEGSPNDKVADDEGSGGGMDKVLSRVERGTSEHSRKNLILWTQLNVGEITYAYDTVTNIPVDAFANALMQSAGFGDVFDIPPSDQFAEMHFEHQMAVFAMRFDVSDLEG